MYTFVNWVILKWLKKFDEFYILGSTEKLGCLYLLVSVSLNLPLICDLCNSLCTIDRHTLQLSCDFDKCFVTHT